MADVTVTAANVRPPASLGDLRVDTADVAITAGQSVYKDTADDEMKLMDADTNLTTTFESGVAISAADADGPLVWAKSGTYKVGGTVVANTTYVASDTAGSIMPESDLTTGQYYHRIGRAVSTTQILIDPSITGTATA